MDQADGTNSWTKADTQALTLTDSCCAEGVEIKSVIKAI